MALSKEQLEHVTSIMQEVDSRIFAKYSKGQEEHGGNLFDLSTIELVDNALDEVIDMAVYLISARRKLTGQSNSDPSHGPGTQVKV